MIVRGWVSLQITYICAIILIQCTYINLCWNISVSSWNLASSHLEGYHRMSKTSVQKTQIMKGVTCVYSVSFRKKKKILCNVWFFMLFCIPSPITVIDLGDGLVSVCPGFVWKISSEMPQSLLQTNLVVGCIIMSRSVMQRDSQPSGWGPGDS